MASGNTLIVFTPNGAEFPSTVNTYATLDVRNNHPCLDFDTGTAEYAYFTGIMPQSYSNTTGITVYVHWAAASATSGTIGWVIALQRNQDGADMTSTVWGPDQTITAATVPATAGILKVTNVAITKGTNMNSVVAGDMFRISVQRNVAGDTASGDAELYAVEIRET